MSLPEFDLPAVEPPESSGPKPPPIGWILVALLFGFLVVAQTAGYFSRSKAEGPKYSNQEQILRSAVYTHEWLDRMSPKESQEGEMTPGKKAAIEAEERNRKQFLSMLDGAAESLASPSKVEPEAALLLSVIRREQRAKVPPEAVAALKRSKDAAFQAAAVIYAEPAPSPNLAKEAVSKLDGEGFAWTMARVHAGELAGDKGVRARELPFGKLMLYGGSLLGLEFLLAAGGILLVTYSIQRRKGNWAPLGHPVGRLTFAESDRFALIAVGLFALFNLIGTVVHFAGASTLTMPGRSLVSTVITLVLVFLVLHGQPLRGVSILQQLGFRASSFATYGAWSLCGLAALQPLLIIAESVSLLLLKSLPPPEHPLVEVFKGGQSTANWVCFGLTAVVLGPIFEEILFRGILLPAFEGLFKKPVWAIVASSLLFGAIHPTGIPAWLPLATVGAMSAMLAYQTRSLVPSIVLHVLHNAMVVLQLLAY